MFMWSFGALVMALSKMVHRFEVLAPNLDPNLFLPCWGRVYSMGPYSEMVYNRYVLTPD